MPQVLDILLTVIITTALPLATTAISVVALLIWTLVIVLSDAGYYLLLPQGSASFVIPIIVFGEGFRFSPQEWQMPTEVIVFLCALSGVSFMATRNASRIEDMFIAGIWGIFAPIITIHVINLFLSNANEFLLQLSDKMSFTTEYAHLGTHISSLTLAFSLMVFRQEEAWPFVLSTLIEIVVGLGGRALLFLYRAIFHFAMFAVLPFLGFLAVSAVSSTNEKSMVGAMTITGIVLASIIISLVVVSVAFHLLDVGLAQHAVMALHYRDVPIIGPRLESYADKIDNGLASRNSSVRVSDYPKPRADQCAPSAGTDQASPACTTLLARQIQVSLGAVASLVLMIYAMTRISAFEQMLGSLMNPLSSLREAN